MSLPNGQPNWSLLTGLDIANQLPGLCPVINLGFLSLLSPMMLVWIPYQTGLCGHMLEPMPQVGASAGWAGGLGDILTFGSHKVTQEDITPFAPDLMKYLLHMAVQPKDVNLDFPSLFKDGWGKLKNYMQLAYWLCYIIIIQPGINPNTTNTNYHFLRICPNKQGVTFQAT
ncbi:uncharacterized protein MELLADRAFT_69725 [Melampsora larici-populina 98AG31]|uniref:Uncharacterized protein n=1 Tax=Melampsora larici-populina (strain 98AG31 / pathotype 3-4-7) TaxID=747676 RepID=F4SBX9_MELLP|nr:uncharacterized protein MELLADRAFT_69725 [Melampsora larici-populina 98AG31]EGF97853.1 hypothetical protein MELLADRAFT_69725 [Melampsora larici-populina 98AG31]